MYSDNYFYSHNLHLVNVLANVFKGAFNVSAYANVNSMTVRVYDVDRDAVSTLVDDLGLSNVVHDVDYDTDYDYYDNPVCNNSCVLVYCSQSLYDLDD